jgi:hypothetical protein
MNAPELTSQAEYAGSIPVIGSTLTWAYSLFGSPGTAGGPVQLNGPGRRSRDLDRPTSPRSGCDDAILRYAI